MNQKPAPEAVDCDTPEPTQLKVAEARKRLIETVSPVTGSERVDLRQSLGRVLSTPIQSALDVPAHTNSAMDGYALRSRELSGNLDQLWPVAGQSLAGRPFTGSIPTGGCVRIMTGACVPAGTDTVIMQEQTRASDGGIRLLKQPEPGQNVRAAGEDIRRGDLVLKPGHRLRAPDLGLLASLGIAEIPVIRRPRIAFFSTGDELRSVGQPLGPGLIYDSNRYSLHGMLQALPVEILDMGVVPDEPTEMKSAFRQAAAQADALITSGGVSVGDADYVKATLQQTGHINFWKVAMKPGRPLAFGQIDDCWFFGLPGNPVSVMVTFYQFVQPALLRLMGTTPTMPLTLSAQTETPLQKKPGRTEFQRGILSNSRSGRLVVNTTGSQGSGVLSSMSRANCFIVLAPDQTIVEAGAEVQVQPFHGLLD
ncbi:MAG: molybdopterin molybdotransferase MoeA [Gammaproteobacteria bacterium]|nr:molybdopterin molybdotransferase MoeA [Gammaproteobacteria bacterium]